MTQKNRTDLNTEATTNLPDNSTREISPADVRNLQVNQNDSQFNLLTDVIEDINATSLDVNTVLAPDGAGGLTFGQVILGQMAVNSVNNGKVVANSLTNSRLATVAQDTIKGRVSAGTGDVEDLTAAQVRNMLNVTDGATKGVNVEDEGIATVTDATTLNFTGAGVVVTDAGGNEATVTISGASGLATKSGVIASGAFTGSPKKATVTFGAAFADANYSLVVTGQDARTWTTESQLAGSVVVNANSTSALSGNTYWTAIKHGET